MTPHLAGSPERIEHALREEAHRVHGEGLPLLDLRGGLKRPMAAASVAHGLGGEIALDSRFWRAVLAIQMVHEASLVHDDVIDGATLRRGEPTTVARHGVATAIVHGDHLLAAGYRLAAGVGSPLFIDRFTCAVQRTIEGEMDQARFRGIQLDGAMCESIAVRKSGELFGIALAAWPLLADHPDADEILELGRRIGLFYQRVDDFLDFCPGAVTGKAPLMDFVGRCWTWPMLELPDPSFDRPPPETAASFFGSGAARRCLKRLGEQADDLTASLSARLPRDTFLREQVLQWLQHARCASAAGVVSPRAMERMSGGPRPPAVPWVEGSSHGAGDQLPAPTTSAQATGVELAASISTTEWVPR